MAIKLIASDLDGTMLTKDYELPPANVEAVRAAAALGVRVTLATGRMFAAALPFARRLGITMPLIAYNGALIKAPDGEVIWSRYLAPELVVRLLAFVFAHRWYVQLYSDEQLLYRESTPAARTYERVTGVAGHAVGESGLLQRTGKVTKLLVIADTPALADSALASLRESFGDEIVAMKSQDTYVEVVHPEVSKGNAVLALAARYGIAAGEIMTLGDGGNDIPMLTAAGLGVAMGNARPHVQAAANAVTDTAERAGVAAAIRRYVIDI